MSLVPIDTADLALLLEAAKNSHPNLLDKYQLAEDPGTESASKVNSININMNNIVIEFYKNNGDKILEGDEEPCRSYCFKARFVGLSEEDNDRISKVVSRIELPVLDYSIPDVLTCKVEFYNITLKDYK